MNDLIEEALKEFDRLWDENTYWNSEDIKWFLRTILEEAYKRGREDQQHKDELPPMKKKFNSKRFMKLAKEIREIEQ